MRGAVLYMGKYGSTSQYADWIAEATAFEAINLYQAPHCDITPYSHLVLGSSVHCGRLRIGGWLRRHWPELAERQPVLFTVSGLPPESPLLKAMLQASLGPGLLARMPCFSLPGRLIHSELKALDRWLLTCEDRLGLRLGAHPGHYLGRSGDFNHVSRGRISPLLAHLTAAYGLRPES